MTYFTQLILRNLIEVFMTTVITFGMLSTLMVISQAPVFVFLVINTTVNCSRYLVRIFIMDDQAKETGRIVYKNNLRTYLEC